MNEVSDPAVLILNLTGPGVFHSLFFCSGHRIESREVHPHDRRESKAFSHEIEVAHDLSAAIDPLGHDARGDLPEKARPMEDEAEPVEEDFHHAGDVPRKVRGREDDAVGSHHLPDEDVPVVLQRTRFLTLHEAELTGSAGLDPVVAQTDDLRLDGAERLEIFQELADGQIRMFPAGRPDDGSDLLHG